MLNKFFLITLGGSGEKLARYLNQDVEQRLRRGSWDKPVPAAWRWLSVDVAHGSDPLTTDVPESLGANGTRLALSRADMDYSDYHYLATSHPKALPGLAGSLPDPEDELPSPFLGAGQRPQVGHVVGLVGLRKLSDAIGREMAILNGPEVTGELAEVSRVMKSPKEAPRGPRTMIVIASSLGGGSGAGLLQVVTETVLGHPATGAHREDLMTVLFTPDIFSELSDQEREWVHANALFTTSSMLNGYESRGVYESLNDLLSNFGAAPSKRRRAAITNFFVSRSNGTITFGNQDAVIKSAAKALGRLLTDETVVSGLEAHFNANREGASVSDKYPIAKTTATSRASSSFGYASISLGDQQLAEYASERLARGQLETFMWGHRRLMSPDEQDRAGLERIAAEELPHFLKRAGLREEDVLKSLYDRDGLKKRTQKLVQKFQDDARRGPRKTTPERWWNRLDTAFNSYQDEMEAERRDQQERNIDEWCAGAQSSLCEATAEAVGRYGAPVAAELLAQAETRVQEAASGMDRERGETLGVKRGEIAKRARQLLTKVRARTLRSGDAALSEASEARGLELFMSEDDAYRALAAEMLRGAAGGIVAPLRAAVERSVAAISHAEANRHREMIESWSRREVGHHLEPSPNQLLLEPLTAMPALLDRLLEETTGKLIREAEAEVVEELLIGRPQGAGTAGGEPAAQGLIAQTGSWRLGRGAPAAFRIDLEVPELRQRAERWARFRPGPVAERLRLSIAEWIGEDQERADILADRLEEALGCAAPMVKLNSAVHIRVHGKGALPPKLHVSTLPIPEAGGARGRVKSMLREVGVPDGELAGLIDGTSEARQVEVSSFLAQPVEPVVVESLFRPIESDWRSRSNAAMREQFSQYRRTRPLPLFVPMSHDKQKDFVKGWIVAGLLGQRTDFVGDWDRRPVSVWSPDGWLRFPAHLLGRGDLEEEADMLGRVLESLPLAIASFASEQYEELFAYMRTIELGNLKSLVEAIGNGVSETGSAVAGDTSQVRLRRMLDRLADQTREIEALGAWSPSADTVVNPAPRYEAAELTLEALTEIREELESMRERDFDDDDEMEVVPA